jgi:F-type H+-transporting ATPase subunit b
MFRLTYVLIVVSWMGLGAVGPRPASAGQAPQSPAADEGAAGAGQAAEAGHAAAEAPGPAPAHGPAAGHGGEGHGEGHAHDPLDLSHGNASPNLASPADLRFDMSIATFVVFLVLLGVLYKFAWGPIALALQQREETIARQMEEARLASERAAQQLREYQARLAAATEEARQIVAEARKDAELARDRVLAEAREAAQKERERVVAEIAAARNQALEQIAQRSVQAALTLAGQILRRELLPEEHEQLIGQAVQQLTHRRAS